MCYLKSQVVVFYEYPMLFYFYFFFNLVKPCKLLCAVYFMANLLCLVLIHNSPGLQGFADTVFDDGQ